jgi:glutamyl/glutaminyl-tRNA synthetase
LKRRQPQQRPLRHEEAGALPLRAHVRRIAPTRFVNLGIETLGRLGIDVTAFPPAYTAAALTSVQEKGKLLRELPTWVDFFFLPDDALQFDPEAKTKALTPTARPLLEKLRERYAAIGEFNAASLEASLKQIASELGVKAGPLVQPCRVACTGRTVGPSLYHLLEILGRDRVLRRLDRALATLG